MSILLRAATLVDGTGADPVSSASVLVEGERVAAIGRGTADEVLDLEGCTLLPGLILLGPANDKFVLSFEVDNLTNADVLEFAADSPVFPSGYTTMQEFQRRYAIQARYNF